MKRIPLRSLPDTRFPPEAPEYELGALRWAVLIEQVIRQPLDPQRGVDLEEMRRGIHILDALEGATDRVLELSEADWEHLCEKVRGMAWGLVDRRLLVFIDEVLGATEDEPEHRALVNGLASDMVAV